MLQPTIAHWCLLIAGIMPYFIVAVAKSSTDYDNENPRNMAGFKTALRQRAHAAHLNAFEAFALFATAVLLATLRGAPAGLIDNLAMLWVVFRLGFVAAYLGNKGTLRSLVWFAATFTTIAIFVIALRSHA